MKVFVINLQKDVDRKFHMEQTCKNLSLDAEFVEGYDGNLLQSNIKSEIYSRFKSLQRIGRELSNGEIGCAISHRKVYEIMVKRDINMALILEDDVTLEDQVIVAAEFSSNALDSWDIIFLGHGENSCEAKVVEIKEQWSSGLALGRPHKNITVRDALAYLIKKPTAEKILAWTKKLSAPIDFYTGNSAQLDLWLFMPVIAHHNEYFASSIGRERLDMLKLYGQKAPSSFSEFCANTGIVKLLRVTRLLSAARVIAAVFHSRVKNKW